jgi:hypothetical protein
MPRSPSLVLWVLTLWASAGCGSEPTEDASDGSVSVDAGVADAGADLAPRACTRGSDCPSEAPACLGQVCLACSPIGVSAECAMHHGKTPLCGSGGGCVECLGNDDCEGQHQTCDTATSTCAPCKTNAECSQRLDGRA